MPGYPLEDQTVVRIGGSYYVTVPNGSGNKRLYLGAREFADLVEKMNAVNECESTHNTNGVPAPIVGGRSGLVQRLQ